jgi:hypothetical protein
MPRPKGYKLSAETKARIGAASRGRTHSSESRAKMGRSDSLHPRWSDNPSYEALHKRIRKRKSKTGICERCGRSIKTEFANISGKYMDDINDFIELCKLCHVRFDKEQGRL